jgi:hypothetical protein
LRASGFALAALLLVAAAFGKTARVTLIPKFAPGERLVYEIEIQTLTTGKTVSPIMNTEGATQSSLRIGMRERLDVLSVERQPAGESVKFRVTWEDSQADAMSDALDPSTADPAAPFDKLQGQSVEFTLAPDGGLSGFKGLENVLPGGIPPAESVAWIASLTAARQFPPSGVAPGQKWQAERPINGAPLAGLYWQTQSAYDHNEACPPVGPGEASSSAATKKDAPAADQPPQCAVILSNLTIARHGQGQSDQTPEDYLRNGLRTAGTWTGQGEAMGSINLVTGLLMSATETSTQNMDYEITSASSGSTIHFMAKSQTQTGITLVGDSQGGTPRAE